MAIIAATGKLRNKIESLWRVCDSAWFGRDVSTFEQPPNVLSGEFLLSVNAAGTGTVNLIGANADNVPVLPNPVILTGKVNYIVTETGANNAIAGTLGANGPAKTIGLTVTVHLAHTLQAGANTFTYAGGTADNIKSHFNVANNIGTAYAVGGNIVLQWDGAEWQDLCQ